MWPYPRIVAHRGGGKLAPENTLAAMRCGHAHGFRAVEFDVMLAKDGVPVLMHDPCLGRTVKGSGKVSDYDAQELAAMDAGSWFGAAFAGEPVPTFEQVAAYCRASQIWMNVEIKPVPGHEVETGREVAHCVQRIFAAELDAQQNGGRAILPLLSSFSFEALHAAYQAVPALPRGYLVEGVPVDWQRKLQALGAIALHVNHKKLTAAQASQIKQAGAGLFCYTVNDPARARMLFSWGVDAFFTDRIDLIGPAFT